MVARHLGMGMKGLVSLVVVWACGPWWGLWPVRAAAGEAPAGAALVDAAGVAGVSIPQGTRLRVYADHEKQGVATPTALAFDAKGRLLVAETHGAGVEDIRDHPAWCLDDLAARTVADRRAWLERRAREGAVEPAAAESERIRLLADGDGDGLADRAGVYAEGTADLLDRPAGGLLEFDGRVYFGCGPKLWRLADKDGDGVAEERVVIEEGFGVRVSLPGHGLQGLALGPDGRIYGTTGDRGFALQSKAGVVHGHPGQGAVFRFEMDGSRFEVVHTGLRNPVGIAFDEFGNAFTVDGGSGQGDKARLVQVVEGADSGWEQENQALAEFYRQLGLDERPPNRWMAERLWEPANAAQPAFLWPAVANLDLGPAGLAFHPGAGFPESERGRFLVCDHRGQAADSGVWSLRMEPAGAGMRLADARPFLRGVAAVDVGFTWDGRVAVADSGAGGRVWMVERKDGAADPQGVAATIAGGFGGLPSVELIDLLGHPDMRVRLRAQVALAAKPAASDQFAAALGSDQRLRRLHAVWGLGMLARGWQPPAANDAGFAAVPDKKTGAAALAGLVKASEDPDDEVRAQVVKAIGEAGILPGELRLEVLLDDKSPRVRSFALIAAGRLRSIGLMGKAMELLEREWAKDPFLRHAGVCALERMAMPEQTLALLGHPSPDVRLAAVVVLRRSRDARVAAFLADEDPRVLAEAVRAIHDLALEDGRSGVAALLDDYAPGKAASERDEMTMRRMLGSAFRLGGDQNVRRLLWVAGCGKVAEAVRLEAVRLLAVWVKPPPVDQVTGHWRPLAERDAASLKKILVRGVGPLLESNGKLLAAVLGLVEQHQLGAAAIDDVALRALVERPAVGDEARAKALGLLVDRGEGEELLVRLAGDPADALAAEAKRLSMARKSARAAAGVDGVFPAGPRATSAAVAQDPRWAANVEIAPPPAWFLPAWAWVLLALWFAGVLRFLLRHLE